MSGVILAGICSPPPCELLADTLSHRCFPFLSLAPYGDMCQQELKGVLKCCLFLFCPWGVSQKMLRVLPVLVCIFVKDRPRAMPELWPWVRESCELAPPLLSWYISGFLFLYVCVGGRSHKLQWISTAWIQSTQIVQNSQGAHQKNFMMDWFPTLSPFVASYQNQTNSNKTYPFI